MPESSSGAETRQVGTGLPTEKRDPLLGNSNVNKHHAVHSFEGHENQQFRKFEAINSVHLQVHHAKFIWVRRGDWRVHREGVGSQL